MKKSLVLKPLLERLSFRAGKTNLEKMRGSISEHFDT